MIREISIKNFKCFLDSTFPFSQLTVLAGINNVGKSTIIQSLLLSRKVVTDFRNFNTKVLLKNEYVNLGSSKQVTSFLSDDEHIYFTIKRKTTGSDLSSLFITFKAESGVVNNYLTVKQFTGFDGFSELSGINILHPSFLYLNAERIGPRDFQHYSADEFNMGIRGEFTSHILHKNERKKILPGKCLNEEENTIFLKPQVEAWMNLIVPGIELQTELNEKSNTVAIEYRHRNYETSFVQPSNIGFGISYVLPVVVAGLIAQKDSILIVENPEAHLHPAGQSKIGQFLAQMAACGVQIILETHSEYIINGIRLAILKKIIKQDNVLINFLSMDVENAIPKIEKISIDNNGELSRWPAEFFDQEELDLAEIFRLQQGKKR